MIWISCRKKIFAVAIYAITPGTSESEKTLRLVTFDNNQLFCEPQKVESGSFGEVHLYYLPAMRQECDNASNQALL